MDTFLQAAFEVASQGLAEGGMPIGSVLVHDGRIIGRLPAAIYTQSVLYTTLSPCAMCSGAILLYRIPRVIVGENVTFVAKEDLLRARGVAVTVLQDARCIGMMQRFIREHPAVWN